MSGDKFSKWKSYWIFFIAVGKVLENTFTIIVCYSEFYNIELHRIHRMFREQNKEHSFQFRISMWTETVNRIWFDIQITHISLHWRRQANELRYLFSFKIEKRLKSAEFVSLSNHQYYAFKFHTGLNWSNFSSTAI